MYVEPSWVIRCVVVQMVSHSLCESYTEAIAKKDQQHQRLAESKIHSFIPGCGLVQPRGGGSGAAEHGSHCKLRPKSGLKKLIGLVAH